MPASPCTNGERVIAALLRRAALTPPSLVAASVGHLSSFGLQLARLYNEALGSKDPGGCHGTMFLHHKWIFFPPVEGSSSTSHLNVLSALAVEVLTEACGVFYSFQVSQKLKLQHVLVRSALKIFLKAFMSTSVFLQPRDLVYLELWCWHWIVNTRSVNTHVRLHNRRIILFK